MKSLLTALSFALFLTCFSQQKPRNTYYLDSLGREIKTTDSIRLKPSDFIRVIQEEESGAYYSLIEYYYDRKIKRTGSASSFKPLKLEGYVTEYYPSGKGNRFMNMKRMSR